MLNVQPMSKDTERRFSFLKKRMKGPKIPRVKLHQTFASKGWNSCSSFSSGTSDANEYNIISSPAKYHKRSSEKQDSHLDRKPMLVEISNIQSVFKESKLNSYKGCPKKSAIKFPEFTQNVHEIEKHSKIYQRKRLNSVAFNIEGVQASFKAKKLLNAEQFKVPSCRNLSSKSIMDNNQKSEKVVAPICVDQNKFHEEKPVSSSCPSPVKYIERSLKLNTSLISEYSPANNKKILYDKSYNIRDKNQNLTEPFDSSELKMLLSNNNSYEDICSIKNDSSTLNNITKNYHKSLASLNDKSRKFQRLSAAFALDNDLMQNEENSDVDIFLIKNESSPTKSRKCINMHQKNHFQFQNLPEAFTGNLVSGKNYAKNCDATIIKNESSPMKEVRNSLKKKIHANNINQNTFLNLRESLSPNFVKSEDMNKKTLYDIVTIQNESNLVKDHLLRTSTDPSAFCVSSFEKNLNKNLLSEEESSAGMKSFSYDNRTFVQMLQPKINDKSTPSEKGSKWMQSLRWSDQAQSRDTNLENYEVFKKTRRNILPGGFAEQMLKLQRKELSERAIWNHKMNEIKKKAGNNYITLILRSVLQKKDCVVTRCSLSDTKEGNIQKILHHWNSEAALIDSEFPAPKAAVVPRNNAFQNRDMTEVFVLFKESVFSKLQLKVGDMFVIYPPWQSIYVPSLHTHAILCTYFVDSLHESVDIVREDISVCPSFPETVHTIQAKKIECNVSACLSNCFFSSSDLLGKSVCVSARIQRIWKNRILNEKILSIFRIEDYASFSLLLQTKDGTYLELKITGNCLPQSFIQFLSEAEGSCFTFYNLKVSHRYNLKKYPQLLNVIEHIKREGKGDKSLQLSQRFCYQFILSSFHEIPDKIEEGNSDFPLYHNFEIKPLSELQKNQIQGIRFSCIGKILFQKKEDFYISDESLLSSRFIIKYYKVKNLSYLKMHKQLSDGSLVLIKEAVVNGNCLIIDQFSRWEILSSTVINKMLLPYQSRLTKIHLITFEHILTSLNWSSNVEEIVLVKGTIAHVDEDSAISWLECSFCSKENLLEDSNSVIYCEDCSCMVPKPILRVKMDVTVSSPSVPNVESKIQLLSCTVKKILKINEDDCQPQCNIADVLGKDIGGIPCYVRDAELLNPRKVFHVTEISCY